MAETKGNICTLIISHAITLQWVTNYHEIMSVNKNEFVYDSELTMDD